MTMMFNYTKSQQKLFLTLFFLIGVSQYAFCDGDPKQIDYNYLRTPEASAFKKYGEESVNEYTGTADISVPLYTIKSKDVEIPLVLRYDASGIKVEQEASWVGLGWNLMVGGCINYVCAGGHDIYNAPDILTDVWTEYLASEFGQWTNGTAIGGGVFNSNDPISRSRTIYYTYNPNTQFNWMNKLPYQPQRFVQSYVDQFTGGWGMKEYVDWGYGERDFYSVNVMGKSFMFFIDPATLKVFHIGKAGEEFIVIPEYSGTEAAKGIGNQPDVTKWTITDSGGFIYEFAVGDKYQADSSTCILYTSCWYLTKILTPLGETVEFEYDALSKTPRQMLVESYKIPFFHEGGAFCCGNASLREYVHFLQNENANTLVTNHYLRKIKTKNQTVDFIMSNSDECSGKKLDAIAVRCNDNDSTEVKTINLSYSSLGHSNIGGNYAPHDQSNASENRLKLDHVHEIASSDTLTTSFSYNERISLPSKRSCAQDFWGYYNGKENNVQGRGHSLLPSPQKFMSSRSLDEISKLNDIKGADRFSSGDYMQAAVLKKVVYPTKGYTTYEYEPNAILTNDFTLTEKYRRHQYDVNLQAYFSGSFTPSGFTESGARWTEFTISQEAKCDLTLTSSCESGLIGKNLNIEIRHWNENTQWFDLLQEKNIVFQSYDEAIPIMQGLVLPEGRYYIGTTLNDDSRHQFGYTWYLQGWNVERTSTPSYYPLECGGLRVKQINNYDYDGGLINYTTYSYSGAQLLNKIETLDYSSKFNFTPSHDPIYANVADKTHNIEMYTITAGHSRMPTFFASCNPGVVGYSNVTKSKYDANNNLEKRIISSYQNLPPVTENGIDYYYRLDNGQMMSQKVYGGDTIVVETNNHYANEMVDHYATNIIANNKSINSAGGLATTYTENQTRYNSDGSIINESVSWSGGGSEGVFDILRYPYILTRSELERSETTEYYPNSVPIVTTKEYLYNDNNHQVSQIDENTSLQAQTKRTKIIYSADLTDDISASMATNAHRLNDIVENKVFLVENNQEQCLSTQHTAFKDSLINGVVRYLPISTSTSIGNNPLETRATYSYDDSLNVRSIILDGVETVYVWSYKGQYPIAKIEGLTYAEVEDAIGAAAISTLLEKSEPTQADLASLRDAISAVGGLATTYTYKPLVGMESQTLPNGNTIRYEYDGFGRLVRVIDNNGDVISTNSYNYKK